MTKKGYQKRLPTVLVPAPRTVPPDEELPTSSPAREADPPDPADPADPPPDPVPVADDPRRSSSAKLAAAAIVGLVVLGVAGVRLASMLQGTPETSAEADGEDFRTAVAGLTAGESYVETRVLPGGDAVVRQWIRTDEPIQLVRLTLPQLPRVGPLSARAIEVYADGDDVVGPARLTEEMATYTFHPATDIEVRYVLSGAVDMSTSAEGRALAVVTTLDVGYAPPAERETHVVRANEVLSLACSPSAVEAPVPCGEAIGRGKWQVELQGERVSERVVAQLTLR